MQCSYFCQLDSNNAITPLYIEGLSCCFALYDFLGNIPNYGFLSHHLLMPVTLQWPNKPACLPVVMSDGAAQVMFSEYAHNDVLTTPQILGRLEKF